MLRNRSFDAEPWQDEHASSAAQKESMPLQLQTWWKTYNNESKTVKNYALLKKMLDQQLTRYNRAGFIEKDPISIPHRFSQKQDIEIAGFFAAIFAWGNRTTIINKCNDLMELMDNAPYPFIINHKERELKRFLDFKHRTFNATDVLHCIRLLRHHYTEGYTLFKGTEPSLESAFTHGMRSSDTDVGNGLNAFAHYFFSLDDSPSRTKKHIPSPKNNSSCKRLNMLLRVIKMEQI